MNGSVHNLIEINTCPACGSSDSHDFESLTSLPAILFPVAAREVDFIPEQPMHVRECLHCGHIYQTKVDFDFNQRIYKDFYSYYPFSNLETMAGPYRKPFDALINFLMSNAKGTLLEIGTSDEGQLEIFMEKDLVCTAINPGAIAGRRATLIDAFFEDWNSDGTFDYIISRFNLEHIIDLDRFFTKIYSYLDDAGMVIIQVPNVAKLFETGILNVFAHEHIHYFNPASMKAAVEKRGFKIEYLSSVNEPSVLCAFRKVNRVISIEDKKIEATKTIASLVDLLENSRDQIVLYGAGLSTTALLYCSTLSSARKNTIVIIDDNPLLSGRCLPGLLTPIRSLENYDIKPETIMILMMNSCYHDVVRDKVLAKAPGVHIFSITSAGLIAGG